MTTWLLLLSQQPMGWMFFKVCANAVEGQTNSGSGAKRRAPLSPLLLLLFVSLHGSFFSTGLLANEKASSMLSSNL
jgi:hypothetical protein